MFYELIFIETKFQIKKYNYFYITIKLRLDNRLLYSILSTPHMYLFNKIINKTSLENGRVIRKKINEKKC